MSNGTSGRGALEIFLTSIPRITRIWFLATIIFSLIGRFNRTYLYYFLLNQKLVFKNYEIWRLITCIFAFPISPQTGYTFLMNMYFLYTISSSLQKGDYSEREGDYVFLLLFCSLNIIIISLFLYSIPFICNSLIMSVLYIWSQLNADTEVSFMFGFRMKALYLPYVIILLNFVMFFGGTEELVGAIVGHIYYFLTYKYPYEFGGRQLISTPQFIKNIFPNKTQQASDFTTDNANDLRSRRSGVVPPVRGHNWGSGRRLDE